jgi:hypothetical protein
VFTSRYALSPYIKQIRFVFKGLKALVYTVEVITIVYVSLLTYYNKFQLTVYHAVDVVSIHLQPDSSNTIGKPATKLYFPGHTGQTIIQ